MNRTRFKSVAKNRFVYIPANKLVIKPNLRFWFDFAKNIWLKYRTRVLIFAGFLLLAIFAAKNILPNIPILKENLQIGVVGEYSEDNLPQVITRLYSQGLTKLAKDDQVLPDLAKSWQTSDGKKFKFILKDNLNWQDGKKLTAGNIQFSSLNAKVDILDDKTIEFTLADSFSPFPSTLTKPAFRRSSQIGTGPYQIKKIAKEGDIVRQIVLVPVHHDLPEVTIGFFPNTQSATQAFKAGQLSVLLNLIKLSGLESWKGSEVAESLDSNHLVAVFYNTKDKLLSEVKVRKALNISIDRSKFKNATAGPYSTNSWVYLELKPVFDLKKATIIIKEGKAENSKIKILTPAIFENLAGEMATNWKSLGLSVELEKIDKIPADFQVAIFGLEIPADPDQYSLWHSTQSHSLTHIEDPKLDKLLEDGRKITNSEERKIIYQQFQKEFREIVPASFLYAPQTYVVINKNSRNKLNKIKKYLPEFPTN